MLVHELIFQGSDDKIALCEKGVKTSYASLKTRVAQYRSYLHARGVRAKENVALLAKNSAEFIFSYLAITSLGCVAVPLNTMLTPREISFVIKDAKTRHIVTDRVLPLTTAEDTAVPVQLYIPEINAEIARQPDSSVPPATILESDPCVILYTSGTTGQPKGALLSHSNLVSNAKSFSEATASRNSDNFLCVLPMFHSLAWTCCVTTPLYNGATITIVETFQPKEVIATIRNCGVTMLIGVPAMFNFYTTLAKPEDLNGVRLFICGGASLPLEIINSFRDKTGKHIIEGYGLSEASPVVSFNPLDKTKFGSIGVPIPGVSVKIVDDDGKEAGPQEIGELIVQGPNVMLGYFGLPGESAKTLRDSWLYTGDMAYMDEEGYIYIVDRKKDLVIVSGLNVYPREVEEILYQHPAVKEAAVIGVPDKKRGERVRAFVVVKDGMKLDKKELLSFLKTSLAQFKLPRQIIELEALPKSATGKILKKELRRLYSD